MKEKSIEYLQELFRRFPELEDLHNPIVEAIELLLNCVKNKGTIFVCGNGGSAADAEHIVGELMKSFLKKRPVNIDFAQAFANKYPIQAGYINYNLEEPIRAVSLVSGVSLPTAYANDVAADMIFAQQVYGLAKENDVLWAISTSGSSVNLNNALRVANVLGCKALGLSGKSGGEMAHLLDVEIRINSNSTPVIQEYHLPIYHCICAVLEEEVF